MPKARPAMNFPEEWAGFGPKMMLLDERERRFVWAYLMNAMTDGWANGAQAARDAGYSDAAGGARVRAHMLLHRDEVLDAMQEVAGQQLRGLAIPAVVALARLVEKPRHKEHRKAVDMVLARVSPVAPTEHKITVEHKSSAQIAALAARLALELGVEPQRLIGVNAPSPVIEGEYVEVPSASASDV